MRTATPPVLSSAAALLNDLFEHPVEEYSCDIFPPPTTASRARQKRGVLTVQQQPEHGHDPPQVRDSA